MSAGLSWMWSKSARIGGALGVALLGSACTVGPDPLTANLGPCTDVNTAGVVGLAGAGTRSYNEGCATDIGAHRMMEIGRQINDPFMIAAGIATLRERHPNIDQTSREIEAALANPVMQQCTARHAMRDRRRVVLLEGCTQVITGAPPSPQTPAEPAAAPAAVRQEEALPRPTTPTPAFVGS